MPLLLWLLWLLRLLWLLLLCQCNILPLGHASPCSARSVCVTSRPPQRMSVLSPRPAYCHQTRYPPTAVSPSRSPQRPPSKLRAFVWPCTLVWSIAVLLWHLPPSRVAAPRTAASRFGEPASAQHSTRGLTPRRGREQHVWGGSGQAGRRAEGLEEEQALWLPRAAGDPGEWVRAGAARGAARRQAADHLSDDARARRCRQGGQPDEVELPHPRQAQHGLGGWLLPADHGVLGRLSHQAAKGASRARGMQRLRATSDARPNLLTTPLPLPRSAASPRASFTQTSTLRAPSASASSMRWAHAAPAQPSTLAGATCK
jgi:hypothetical protein